MPAIVNSVTDALIYALNVTRLDEMKIGELRDILAKYGSTFKSNSKAPLIQEILRVQKALHSSAATVSATASSAAVAKPKSTSVGGGGAATPAPTTRQEQLEGMKITELREILTQYDSDFTSRFREPLISEILKIEAAPRVLHSSAATVSATASSATSGGGGGAATATTCGATKADGTGCTRNASVNGYCKQHWEILQKKEAAAVPPPVLHSSAATVSATASSSASNDASALRAKLAKAKVDAISS